MMAEGSSEQWKIMVIRSSRRELNWNNEDVQVDKEEIRECTLRELQ